MPFLHLNPLSKAPPSPSTNHESDLYLLPAISAVQLRAWLSAGLWQTMYCGPPSTHPGIIEANIKRHRKSLLEEDEYRITSCVGCHEPEVGEEWSVVGFIKYRIANREGEAKENAVAEKRTFPEGVHLGMIEWLWPKLMEGRARFDRELGGKYVFVETLATDPNWQRCGAGKLLMEEACAEADRRGWPAWLEATPEGRRLYEQVGFVAKEELWVDLARWEGAADKGEGWRGKNGEAWKEGEGEGWYLMSMMVREARPVNG